MVKVAHPQEWEEEVRRQQCSLLSCPELTAARARIEDLDLTVSMLKGYIEIAANKLRVGENPSDVAGFLNLVLGKEP